MAAEAAGAPDTGERLSRWFRWIRLGVIPIAVAYIAAKHDSYPSGYEAAAWIVTIAFAAVAIGIFVAQGRGVPESARRRLYVVAIAADFAFVAALVFVFSYQAGQPMRSLVFLVAVAGALRFGLTGGLAIALAAVAVLFLADVWRHTEFDRPFDTESVVVRSGLLLAIGLVVGRLTDELAAEGRRARDRADEAEGLRDELGRRVDLLEAANRAARALGSSLEIEVAFGAFIRELRGLVPFDRTAIVLAEEGAAAVMATSGRGSKRVFPPGTTRPVVGSVLDEVLQGRAVYRADLEERRYPEDEILLELGLRSELVAPLLLGARAVGMISVSRAQPDAFSDAERELITLLGRLVATAVQNIRAYEAERRTVEELRRLSALRADFVSLVSHELRSPMASVIGSARTLQARWRELSPDQRQAFLGVIADETSRLSVLIGDVLDTSRIEAGTFGYTFSDVDVAALVRETVASAGLGQDEVALQAAVRDPLPHVRGDIDRLRQVLMNLIENAVKYSPAGEEVRVDAYANGRDVLVQVADHGPGIASENQRLIFEKFGRVSDGSAKPGTGLGLYIARSIAEAHGGSLVVRSAAGSGATFTLSLPAASGDAGFRRKWEPTVPLTPPS
jgi:signal transduction histidine kinase